MSLLSDKEKRSFLSCSRNNCRTSVHSISTLSYALACQRGETREKISDVKYAWKIQLNARVITPEHSLEKNDKWCFINKIMLIHTFDTPLRLCSDHSSQFVAMCRITFLDSPEIDLARDANFLHCHPPSSHRNQAENTFCTTFQFCWLEFQSNLFNSGVCRLLTSCKHQLQTISARWMLQKRFFSCRRVESTAREWKSFSY